MGEVWQHHRLWPLMSGAAVKRDHKDGLCSLLLLQKPELCFCTQARPGLRTGTLGKQLTGVTVEKGCESYI